MTINLGSVIFSMQKVTLIGQRDANGPTVIIEGGGLVVGSNSNIRDIQIEHAPGIGLIVNGGSTVQGCVLNANGAAGLELQGRTASKETDWEPDGDSRRQCAGHLPGGIENNTLGDPRQIATLSANKGLSWAVPALYDVRHGFLEQQQDLNFTRHDIAGTIALPNRDYGVMIGGTGNKLGGSPEYGQPDRGLKAHGQCWLHRCSDRRHANNSGSAITSGRRWIALHVRRDGDPEVQFGIFALAKAG